MIDRDWEKVIEFERWCAEQMAAPQRPVIYLVEDNSAKWALTAMVLAAGVLLMAYVHYNTPTPVPITSAHESPWVDPIIWPDPGFRGKTHVHQFYGNETTPGNFYYKTPAPKSDSKSGYWSPVMKYHCPRDSTEACDKARDGEIVMPPAKIYVDITGTPR